MELSQKISTARKIKGLTQEELADKAAITARTIQRIESGETRPRPYTLKTLAAALDIPYEELVDHQISTADSSDTNDILPTDREHYQLQLICISCFSYLVVPLVHFLIPAILLKKSGLQDHRLVTFARTAIRRQVYWTISLWLILFATMGYNFIRVIYFEKTGIVNFLWPFFLLYTGNAGLIFLHLYHLKRIASIQFAAK
ncbi:helix-turn-helix transcriptional regulator [Flavihumibacter sp. CACIAM 22H1]|uniref:helix-turn-helix domain-containing protein n=1 Tax=Flavihumibacter sp. CACIAM 22H1 TaxID=1812911 RepID=UPI0025B8F3D5|nr:helix-turn-helix transcriptional regulator [Flavihumibacter sp. CACIAM 22H1]